MRPEAEPPAAAIVSSSPGQALRGGLYLVGPLMKPMFLWPQAIKV